MATHDPANVQWQHDLYVILEKIGNVQTVQGDLDNAFSSYKNSYRAGDSRFWRPKQELPAETVAAYQSTLQLTQKIFSSY